MHEHSHSIEKEKNIEKLSILSVCMTFVIILLILTMVVTHIKKEVRNEAKQKIEIHLSGAYWNATKYIKQGISYSENTFTWTDGKNVAFDTIDVQKNSKYKLTVDYIGTFDKEQSVIIYANGICIFNGVAEERGSIEADIDIIDDNKLKLSIELPDAISPYEKGESEDSRTLALMLEKITLQLYN